MTEQARVSEAAFVVECVRCALASEQPTAFDGADSTPPRVDIPADLDWERVVTITRWNGVVPLVHEALQSRSEAVPEDIRADLREHYRHNATQNLMMVNALHEIVQAFRDQEVRAVPFKGPVLAAFAYGDLNRRMFHDLDILIHPADRNRAADVLRELGYEFTHDIDDVGRIQESPVFQRSLREYHLERPADDVTVELRWAFEGDHLPAVEAIWGRRAEQTVAGESVPALSPTDRFVVQADHATKHCCFRLGWVADVAVTAARIDDWDAVLDRIAAHQCGRWVSVSLRLALDLFEAPVPEAFWTHPAVPTDSSLGDEMYGRWVRNPIDPLSKLDKFRFHARLRSPREVVRDFAKLVFTPSLGEYELLPLPPLLHPLYYLCRPFRLAYNLPRYRQSIAAR